MTARDQDKARHGAGTAEFVLLAVLALPALAIFAGLLYRASLPVSIAYNEGWNAYHAQSLIAGGALYYPPQALVTNNYPPLSFLLVGPLAHVFGNTLMAGRAIAALAFAGLVAAVMAVLHCVERDLVAALAGGLVLFVFMVVNEEGTILTDDPQILAHFVGLLGLYVLLRWSEARWASPVAAAIICASLLIKQNLIALPIAIALWLLIVDSGAFARFAASGVLFMAAAVAACLTSFGHDFVSSILAPRRYSLVRAWHSSVVWLSRIVAAMIVAWLGVAIAPRHRFSWFCGIYLASGLVVGSVSLLGDGVDSNAFYELVVACALGSGHLVAVAQLSPSGARLVRAWAIVAGLFAVALTPGLIVAKDALNLPSWIAKQRAESAATRETVALIAEQPGPVLCTLPILCYWAGKRFELDPFSYVQSVAKDVKKNEMLRDAIASRRYAAIEMNGELAAKIFSPALMQVVKLYYAPVPVPLHGIELYVRQPS